MKINYEEKSDLRDAFVSSLLSSANIYKNMMVFDAGAANLVKTSKYKLWYEDRYLNVGLAENNLVGMAAGMCVRGKLPVICGAASMIVGKAWEQIRNLICYPNLNVKIVGVHTGFSAGMEGHLYQSFEDLALMRVLPNMQIFSPADAVECRKIMNYAMNSFGPVYIRLSSGDLPLIYDENYDFKPGSGDLLNGENEVLLIATGAVVIEALKAVDLLKLFNLKVNVLNLSTLKPIDVEYLTKIVDSAKYVFTIEDHSVIGGLGSLISELASKKIYKIGVNDRFGESGIKENLYKKYNLDGQGISEVVLKQVGLERVL